MVIRRRDFEGHKVFGHFIINKLIMELLQQPKILAIVHLAILPFVFLWEDFTVAVLGLIIPTLKSIKPKQVELMVTYWICYILLMYFNEYYSNWFVKVALVVLLQQEIILKSITTLIHNRSDHNLLKFYHTLVLYFNNFTFDTFIYLNEELIRRTETDLKEQ